MPTCTLYFAYALQVKFETVKSNKVTHNQQLKPSFLRQLAVALAKSKLLDTSDWKKMVVYL